MRLVILSFLTDHAFQPTVELKPSPLLYSICPEPSCSRLTKMHGAKKIGLMLALSYLCWTTLNWRNSGNESVLVANWSCFSAHSWTKTFSSSLLYLSWAFLFSADKDARCEEDRVNAGIELSLLNNPELEEFWQWVSTHGWRRWARISSIIKHVRAWERIDPSWWILWIFLRKKLVACTGIHVVAKGKHD